MRQDPERFLVVLVPTLTIDYSLLIPACFTRDVVEDLPFLEHAETGHFSHLNVSD